MLLVQLFSILEAYLADAIIKLAFDEPGVAAAIVEWHPELKDQQISLKRVATEPYLMRDLVIDQLRKTQFHRFEFVNGMLRASFDHHMLPKDKGRRDILLKSVQRRHDCAHRNGRNQDGHVLGDLTVAYLEALARKKCAMSNTATQVLLGKLFINVVRMEVADYARTLNRALRSRGPPSARRNLFQGHCYAGSQHEWFEVSGSVAER
jgi:hypothetical protein